MSFLLPQPRTPKAPSGGVPGPTAPMAAQTLQWLRRPLAMLEGCRARHGPTFRLALAPEPLVMLTAPDDLRAVFAARPDAMSAGVANRRVARVMVGSQSTISVDGEAHAQHRALLRPAFHPAQVQRHGPTITRITAEVVGRFPRDASLPLHPAMQEIALRVIVRCVLGADAGPTAESLTRQLARFLRLGDLPAAALPILYLSTHPEAERLALWRVLLSGRDRVRGLLRQQIALRRCDPTLDARDDVLAALLRTQGGLEGEVLLDELMMLMSAGHETTATALCWCFEEILADADVERALRAELEAAGGADATPEVIAALPFLDATIKEVLRLRPVLPFVRRRLLRPALLGGYELPEGTTVAPCIYLAQRDPEVYREPGRFLPSRFLSQARDGSATPARLEPSAWLPFGGGGRHCAGAALAQLELKLIVAGVLSHSRPRLSARRRPRTVQRAITFFPEGGTRVRT